MRATAWRVARVSGASLRSTRPWEERFGRLPPSDGARRDGATCLSRSSCLPAFAPLVAPSLGSLLQRELQKGLGTRGFGTTDGPFKHLKPKFTEHRAHYQDTLIFGDVRKLMRTSEEVLAAKSVDQQTRFPQSFWEIFPKRAVKSMHLFSPGEMALLAKAFDTPACRGAQTRDVYEAMLLQISRRDEGVGIPTAALRSEPGGSPGAWGGLPLAILIDVFSRWLGRQENLGMAQSYCAVLEALGSKVLDAMWELKVVDLAQILSSLARMEVRDTALCRRTAEKVRARMSELGLKELADVAAAMAGQNHRDVALFRSIARRAAEVLRSHDGDERAVSMREMEEEWATEHKSPISDSRSLELTLEGGESAAEAVVRLLASYKELKIYLRPAGGPLVEALREPLHALEAAGAADATVCEELQRLVRALAPPVDDSTDSPAKTSAAAVQV